MDWFNILYVYGRKKAHFTLIYNNKHRDVTGYKAHLLQKYRLLKKATDTAF
jgi:hypothetical protein